mmetsp:Transcript_17483/g.33225  ORF Transcript_17483/g.33225 Transcript_17483/m.33225 type:complete len:294 (-) Transcript_17483:793-1674(-)
MKTIGFSLSPGGLLLPYHAGVLDGLEYNRMLTPESPLAGASAGGIAVAAHACGISGPQVLEATIAIADDCTRQGGAMGRILPRLRYQLDQLVGDSEFETFQNRPSPVTIAYREVFPNNRHHHATKFENRHELINTVCHSSMFPFFTSRWPVAIDPTHPGPFPRLVVDGFFAVPMERFGCPDFSLADVHVDRTVLITPFPHESLGLGSILESSQDCISPAAFEDDPHGLQLTQRLLSSTQPLSREALTEIYEQGLKDAEAWCRREKDRETETVVAAVLKKGSKGTWWRNWYNKI